MKIVWITAALALLPFLLSTQSFDEWLDVFESYEVGTEVQDTQLIGGMNKTVPKDLMKAFLLTYKGDSATLNLENEEFQWHPLAHVQINDKLHVFAITTSEPGPPSEATSSCQKTIIVQDNTAPTAVCQPAIAYLDGTGNANVNASAIDGGSADSYGILTYQINGQPSVSYNCSQIGAPQAATLVVTDVNGNVDSCTTTVTVLDTIAPTAICGNLPPINLSSTGDTVLTPFDIDNGSTDNCFLFSRSISPDRIDRTAAPQGVVTVTLTVEDASGNTDFCTTGIQVNLDGE